MNEDLKKKAVGILEKNEKFFLFTSSSNGESNIISNISTYNLAGIMTKYKNYFTNMSEQQSIDLGNQG
jgi:hypothetical protein